MRWTWSIFLFGLIGTMSCHDATAPDSVQVDLRTRFHLQALPSHPAYPASNQPDNNRMLLGWWLFSDPILSATKDVACGTCHNAYFGMGDGRSLSVGVHGKGLGPARDQVDLRYAVTARNAPALMNLGYIVDADGNTPMFWDGRAANIEAQVLEPLKSAAEMRADYFTEHSVLDSIVGRLRAIARYETLFRQAFHAEEDSVRFGLLPDIITVNTLAKAIANFERHLISANSRYDAYARGVDTAVSEQEKQGLEVFCTKAGCIACHSGPMFSDFKFYAQGVAQTGPGRDGFNGDDWGRAEFTGRANDRYKFRTPTLRNLDQTAPYMHDGSLATLDEVIDYYDKGASANTNAVTTLDPRLVPLHLTAVEKASLKAFLLTLTDDSWYDLAVPPGDVPSGLDVPHR